MHTCLLPRSPFQGEPCCHRGKRGKQGQRGHRGKRGKTGARGPPGVNTTGAGVTEVQFGGLVNNGGGNYLYLGGTGLTGPVVMQPNPIANMYMVPYAITGIEARALFPNTDQPQSMVIEFGFSTSSPIAAAGIATSQNFVSTDSVDGIGTSTSFIAVQCQANWLLTLRVLAGGSTDSFQVSLRFIPATYG
jgi:hypothetical protein